MKKNLDSILLFTFEDTQIIEEVNRDFDYKRLKIIFKADIIGKSLNDIKKLIRQEYFDIFILSNRNSQLNRTPISLEILALISKSKNQLIYYNDQKSDYFNKVKLFLKIIPFLILGSISGLFLLIKTYLLFWIPKLFISKLNEDRSKSKNDKKTIFYLRTDLAGKITAGGSLSHIKGFISGAEELGYKIIYFADYPAVANITNEVIQPNKLFDFFDELQLIDYHFKVIKTIKNYPVKPDLIYQRHSVFNDSGAFLAKYFNVPLILEVNSSEVWVRKNWSRLVLENIAKKFENHALTNADIMGVVSDIVKQEILPLGTKEEKIVINPNGVNPNIFSPDINCDRVKQKYNIGNKIVIGFIGTFTKWHGVEVLFNAAKELLQSNKNLLFLFVGEGNLKIKLEKESNELGLAENIIFTGLIPHQEAPEYLASCDILVSPHSGFDTNTKFFGSPTKLFEYMAMGKAIIASDLEQIGKIINDGLNGLKVKPGDVEDLKQKISKLAIDEELRNKLGKNARKDVEDNYTWKKNAERVLKYFQ